MIKAPKFLKKCGFALLAALSLASACTEEIPYVIVNQNAIVASQETTKFNILVDSNSDWKAESKVDWIRLYANSGSGYGSFEMVLDTNHSAAERNAEVVVTGGGCTAVITVVQGSADLALVTPVTDYYIGADAQDIDVEFIVSCNDAAVKAFSNTDWVEIGAVGASSVKISVAENAGGESRDAEVKISGASSTGKAVVNTVAIHQGGTDNILDVLVDSLSIASMGETIKVPVQTNAEIDAVSSSDWCSAAVSDKNVLISAAENMTGETREAIVTVSVASQRGKPLSKAITVTQESVAIGVTIPISEYTVDNAAQDVIVKYNLSSPDFKLEGVSSAKWAEVTSVSDGAAVVAVEKNSSRKERLAEIALTATNANGVAFTAKTNIRQSETAKDVLEILVPEVNVKAEGESMKIPFNSDAEVTAKSSAYWCIAKIEGNDVAIEVSKNVGPAREAFITLTTAGGESGTIKVTQSQSADSIDLPVKEVSAKAEGGIVRIPYTDKAQATVSSNVDWCSVSIEDDYIVAELDANADENIREAYVTVKTEDGNSGLVHILQAAKSKDTLEILTPEVNVVSTMSTTKIPFVSNADVQARSSVEWITVIVDGKDVVATISANTNEQPREGYITLTTEGGAVAVAHIMQAVGIQDEPNEYLNVVVDVLYAPKEGASLNIPFTSSTSVTAVATVNWISLNVDKNAGVVTVTVDENNTGKDRNAYVVLTNKDGLSYRVEIIQVSANALYVALTEFTASYKGESKTVPYKAEGTVTVKTTEDWITASADGDNIVIEVAANEGDSEREGYVVVTDQSGNAAYIHVNQTYDAKDADEIAALVTSIYFTGEESSIRLPFTMDNVEGELSIKSSSDWLTGTIDDLDVIVHADENWSGNTRTGYLTVTTPEGVVALITVNQTTLTPVFEFETADIVMSYTAGNASTLLLSTGDWEIVDSESIPAWLTVTPINGTDDTIITLVALANKFASERNAVLYFQNTDHNMAAKLTVTQEGNPNGMVEFLHLGKGYDTSGKYAEEAFVKAKVLDPEKLVAGDHIADLLSPNASVEEIVTGKTRQEYQKNYSASAGVSASYLGFTASVEFNFSQKALSTSEYSFATLRHMTKKQILKIYENETSSDLKECLTDIFLEDVEKAVGASDIAAAAKSLVDKYGTHVITGFSLGGVLEYSMAADASTNETETDWGVAVKAGFEKEGIGGASASSSYNEFESLKTQSSGFESKLVCRGGESQYTSSGYGEGAGTTPVAYESWLSSLEKKESWVMVDYEGSRLLPLWEFIDDSALAAAVQANAESRLQGSQIEQQSGRRQLELIFLGFETYGMYNLYENGKDTSKWGVILTSTVDGRGQDTRTIFDTSKFGMYESPNFGKEIPEPTADKPQYIEVKNKNGEHYTTGTFSLTKSQKHNLNIDLGALLAEYINVPVFFTEEVTTLSLSCEAGSDFWTYQGIREEENNKTFYVYDKDSSGKNTRIVMYPKECIATAANSYVRLIFEINWK